MDKTLYRVALSDVALYPAAMSEYLITPYLGGAWGVVYEIVANFVYINLGLAIFNLLPVPPLDGYHVFNDLLLKKSLYASPRAARIGQGVLLVLVWTGALSRVLGVVEDGVMNGVGRVFLLFFRLLKLG